MNPIIVHLSDERWTLEALHLASAMARSAGSRVVLLRLVLANHPGLLGWGLTPPTPELWRFIEACASVAEDYGVEARLQSMQYISLVGALAQAADMLNAAVLFAHVPPSAIPFWKQVQLWNLQRQLGQCRLYTLDTEQPISLSMHDLSPAVENRR